MSLSTILAPMTPPAFGHLPSFAGEAMTLLA
jgi:hypothetical protein